MIDELLKRISERPMLHGALVGIVGLTVAQILWAYVPGPAGTLAVLLWAAIVSGYIAGNS